MGNQQLVRILSDIGVTDISQRDVNFQDGLLHAKAIFQRHNYQLYQVHCPNKNNPFGFDPDKFNLTLRVIRCLNDNESIEILKSMQEKVVSLMQHPNLVRFYMMAIIAEDHNQKQKAGFIGLPGLYKSVQGTTDYKNDTIQFILVEEDHLQLLSSAFFGDQQVVQSPETLRKKFTLKQFMDRILPNPLLIEYFSSDETLIYQLIVQCLTALAFLNENNMTHQDFLPQNIIIELISPFENLEAQNSINSHNDFDRKFKIKLGEYLKIKMLSDIAFQKTLLIQTQTKFAQEKNQSFNNQTGEYQRNNGKEQVQKLIQQLKENKNLYSQYDPPEKVEKDSIEVKLNKNAGNNPQFEDFDIKFKPIKLQNFNCDIYSLGIIILEIYLSLYIYKKDCKDMVHNLYLNRLSYQSRCILINEIIDNKKNPIICSLIKEMLRDSEPQSKQGESFKIIDEKTMYDELILNTQNYDLGRPSAQQMLSKNRIVHYFAYISDNIIEDRYLPRDINLLQVFITNEMFVPMLIKCGMQSILNRKKSIICFFSLMTLYLKNANVDKDDLLNINSQYGIKSRKDDPSEKSKVQQFILDSLIDSKAYIEMIELLSYCLSSELQTVLQFFTQNLNPQNDYDPANLEIDEQIFKNDFLEQKQAGLECLLMIIKIKEQQGDLFSFLTEIMSAGLVSLLILLTQIIRNQKWMRKKQFSLCQLQTETNDPMTLYTLEIIEKLCYFGFNGHSLTIPIFLDKTGFYLNLIESVFDQNDDDLTVQQQSRQISNQGLQSKSFLSHDQDIKVRKFQDQRNITPSGSQSVNAFNSSVIDASKTDNPAQKQKNHHENQETNQKSIINLIYKNDETKKSQSNLQFNNLESSKLTNQSLLLNAGSESIIIAPELIQNEAVSQKQRLNVFKKIFRDRIIDFLQNCTFCMSEKTLKQLLSQMSKSNNVQHPDFIRCIELLQSKQMQKLIFQQSFSFDFKIFIIDTLTSKFESLQSINSLRSNSRINNNYSLIHNQSQQRIPSVIRNNEGDAFQTFNSQSNLMNKQQIEQNQYPSQTSRNNQGEYISLSTVKNSNNQIINMKKILNHNYTNSRSRSKQRNDNQNGLLDLTQQSMRSVTKQNSQNQNALSQPKVLKQSVYKRGRSCNSRAVAHHQISTQINGRGPLSDFERLMCEVSGIIYSFVDGEAYIKFQNAINKCIATQTCLSSQRFIILSEFSKFQNLDSLQQIRQNFMKIRPQTAVSPVQKRKAQHLPQQSDQYSNLQKTQVKKQLKGEINLQSEEKRNSVKNEIMYEENIKKLEDENMQIPHSIISNMAQYFYVCKQCDQQIYCLVCAIKFHQNHQNIQPLRTPDYNISNINKMWEKCLNEDQDPIDVPFKPNQLFCHTEQIERYIHSSEHSTQELIQLKQQLHYIDSTFLWDYQPDEFTLLSSFDSYFSKSQIQDIENSSKKKKQSSGYISNSQTNKQSKQTLKQNASQIQKNSKLPNQMKGQNDLYQEFLKRGFINFDIFDKQSIQVEGETHFINIDQGDQQHAMICSTPLEIFDQLQLKMLNSKNYKEMFYCQRQQYFEVAIHSSGFYDQVQIGLLFIHEKDLQNGIQQNQEIIQSLKNLTLIPGYEPMSIGYHGDDGNIYNNISQDLGIDNLIKKAQVDSEQLLEEAETADSSLFDINNSNVYGGIYAPPFSSGDQVGCGILQIDVDVQHYSKFKKSQEHAIYFTRNGVCLPAVKIQCQNLKMFPVISVKGKFCHIEVIQDIERYKFNIQKIKSIESQRIIEQQLLQNIKFMKCLSQFNQIINQKGRRMSFTAAPASSNVKHMFVQGYQEQQSYDINVRPERQEIIGISKNTDRGFLTQRTGFKEKAEKDNNNSESKSNKFYNANQQSEITILSQSKAKRFAPDNLLRLLKKHEIMYSQQETIKHKKELKLNTKQDEASSTIVSDLKQSKSLQNIKNSNVKQFNIQNNQIQHAQIQLTIPSSIQQKVQQQNKQVKAEKNQKEVKLIGYKQSISNVVKIGSMTKLNPQPQSQIQQQQNNR